MPNQISRHARSLIALLAIVASTLGAPAQAQQNPEPVERAARTFLQQQTAALPGKVSIQVTPFDPRNQLPPCAAIAAFLPPGTRAWGRINLGIRCDSPVTWTAYLPVQITVVADYLVASRALRGGQIISPSDLERRTGDIAAESAAPLTDTTQAVGQRARYSIAAGSAITTDALILPQIVRQGQTVKILGVGEGFTVANEGRAMNAAAAGEAVRVRLANGQVVTGTARADGAIEIRF
ncbi:MAG TPA: flagellar basal body P-ring formation chaperone FlgA [Aromatoleum sp.]|uniref:flagellar basal body P-ring formation chaperone FlgA n=1 Tax=Aromatoleum sp. TaxID=2307007 RepID=UPI002B48786C|nr:flagellar basal body P-ring formation chaperone FlgA [Aromatoleum sp.]HJV26650.1 flagellar basal body P-ring formation chaperone FlgA [Aromatoleum sp.]